MISKTTLRRLERLGSRAVLETPQVLRILVTRIGEPDETIELILDRSYRRGPGAWKTNREGDR